MTSASYWERYGEVERICVDILERTGDVDKPPTKQQLGEVRIAINEYLTSSLSNNTSYVQAAYDVADTVRQNRGIMIEENLDMPPIPENAKTKELEVGCGMLFLALFAVFFVTTVLLVLDKWVV